MIEDIRRENNVNWMDILRIALRRDPDSTKKLLNSIKKKDARISLMMRELAK